MSLCNKRKGAKGKGCTFHFIIFIEQIAEKYSRYKTFFNFFLIFI